eukprot:15472723-Alexandrium_andersonii.AAC.3
MSLPAAATPNEPQCPLGAASALRVAARAKWGPRSTARRVYGGFCLCGVRFWGSWTLVSVRGCQLDVRLARDR